ncbi:hypothetical protein BT69DRAFT_1346951 [Atractiella rhizophila]|nr:hypothetical protein BT69DRAFT_1346951 [Atractiella rhizophila]
MSLVEEDEVLDSFDDNEFVAMDVDLWNFGQAGMLSLPNELLEEVCLRSVEGIPIGAIGKQLGSLALVSKTFNRVATSFLFRTAVFTGHTHLGDFCWILERSQRLRNLTTTLVFLPQWNEEQAAQNLALGKMVDGLIRDPFFTWDPVRAIRLCPNLKSLSYTLTGETSNSPSLWHNQLPSTWVLLLSSLFSYRQIARSSVVDGLKNMFSHLYHLSRLHVDQRKGAIEFSISMLRPLQNLRELALEGWNRNADDPWRESVTFPRLVSLSIWDAKLKRSQLRPFLEILLDAPSLQRLQLRRVMMPPCYVDEAWDYLAPFFPTTLTHINIASEEEEELPEGAAIQLLSQLRSLKYFNCRLGTCSTFLIHFFPRSVTYISLTSARFSYPRWQAWYNAIDLGRFPNLADFYDSGVTNVDCRNDFKLAELCDAKAVRWLADPSWKEKKRWGVPSFTKFDPSAERLWWH